MSIMNKVTLVAPLQYLKVCYILECFDKYSIGYIHIMYCGKKKMWFFLEIQRNLFAGNWISIESWKITQIGKVKNDGEDIAVREDILDKCMLKGS